MSANRYGLHDDRHPEHTGSGYFEAHRIHSKLAGGEEPHRSDNVGIAYDKEAGSITGKTGALGNGIFRNVAGSVTMSEIENKINGCSGGVTKCLKSVTISTDQQGWPGSQSYTIKIN